MIDQTAPFSENVPIYDVFMSRNASPPPRLNAAKENTNSPPPIVRSRSTTVPHEPVKEIVTRPEISSQITVKTSSSNSEMPEFHQKAKNLYAAMNSTYDRLNQALSDMEARAPHFSKQQVLLIHQIIQYIQMVNLFFFLD